MNNIPQKLKAQLLSDPEYQYCCFTGQPGSYEDPVEWHHNLIYEGKQVQERFCILPVLRSIHKHANNKHIKEVLDWIMLNRATDEELTTYSKALDLRDRKETLNARFGAYIPVEPVTPGSEKYFNPGFLHPVSEEEMNVIERARKHWREYDGTTYSPEEMLKKVILDFGKTNMSILENELTEIN